MYCIYSTQSRCRARNPAVALKVCTPICTHLKQVYTLILRAMLLFYVYTSQYTLRCRAQAPPAGLRTPLPHWDNINKGMHFFLALFFKIFFIFIFFRHIICVRRKDGGVKKPLVCGVLGIPPIRAGFSPPAASPNLRRSLTFLTWRGLSGSGMIPAVGAVFFCSFWLFSIFFLLF